MRIRSTKPEFWRSDHRGHFVKRAIPGSVKQVVVERAGATPGTTSPIECHYCGREGTIWWPLTYTGKVGSHMVMRGFVISCRPCNRSKKDKVL